MRRPCSSSSVKTGTNAALSAASANSAAHEVRDLEGDRERGERARSCRSSSRPRSRARARRCGESPVAIEKIAVLRATARARRGGLSGAARPSARRSRVAVGLARHVARDATARPGALRPARAPRASAARYTAPLMANIHSQKKRILRAERERLENRRYTSKIKTYFRRLEAAVAAGDDETADDRAPRAGAARSTRPSSAARCTATRARARSPAPPACVRAGSQRRRAALTPLPSPARLRRHSRPDAPASAAAIWPSPERSCRRSSLAAALRARGRRAPRARGAAPRRRSPAPP